MGEEGEEKGGFTRAQETGYDCYGDRCHFGEGGCLVVEEVVLRLFLGGRGRLSGRGAISSGQGSLAQTLLIFPCLGLFFDSLVFELLMYSITRSMQLPGTTVWGDEAYLNELHPKRNYIPPRLS